MKLPNLLRDLSTFGIFAPQSMNWAQRPNPAVSPVGMRIRVADLGNMDFVNTGKVWVQSNLQPFAQSAVAQAVTGTTAETTLASINIPAGLLGTNGSMRVSALFSCTNNANNKTLQVKLGTSAFYNATVSTVSGVQCESVIRNRGSQASQVGSTGAIAGLGSVFVGTYTVDTSVNQILSITGTLANGADTLTLEAFTLEVLPA